MTIEIGGNFDADAKTQKYVTKVIHSLEKYLPKSQRDATRVIVILNRVDRPHNNKYEAEVTVHAGSRELSAKDSTLNVLAALDIVRRKLALDLKNGRTDRLPRR